MSNSSATNSGEKFSWRFTMKWILAGVIIFVGIAGGVYTGMALSNAGYGKASSEVLTNNTYLELGQPFPDYELRDVFDSTQTTVSALASHGPLLLVFSSTSCGACNAMEAFWKKKVFPKLDPRVQLVWVYNSAEALPQGNELSTFGVRKMITNRNDQLKEDGINSTPTLVGIDRSNIIRFIYTGFDRKIGSGEINELL